jgi:hypothetical protein
VSRALPVVRRVPLVEDADESRPLKRIRSEPSQQQQPYVRALGPSKNHSKPQPPPPLQQQQPRPGIPAATNLSLATYMAEPPAARAASRSLVSLECASPSAARGGGPRS